MITSGDWKLIVYPTIRLLRLYNLSDDPEELVDLACKAEYETVIRRLLVQMRAKQKLLDDPLELPELIVSGNETLPTSH
jgi:choline-sulfatase